ncbi:hypothetical protein DB347_04195 [Opitutaceae bacterium EW11]|nr:hypothetical protein DB347_04195 [Opitutaceae bacterium EW11]
MKPFLSGRAQVPNASLQSSFASVRESGIRVVGHSHVKTGAEGDAQPTVECVKQGDKVVRLIVTCTCGEKIEIDCVYPG